MTIGAFIANDRQAREAVSQLDRLDKALSSEQTLAAIVSGLPNQAVDGVRRALKTEHRELQKILAAYEAAKNGQYDELKRAAGQDPGATLIVARITKGLSQKELARKLGLKEQAVQRYEAEKYRSISLANFRKVAQVLGVAWEFEITTQIDWGASLDVPPVEARKVLKHARANNWFQGDDRSDDDALGQLKTYVADHVVKHGTPSLLRTGMNVQDHSQDWCLLSWKAQVTRRAEKIIAHRKLDYLPMEVSWLMDLVRLSVAEDGPIRAQEMLADHGIVLIAENYIPGMSVDGAAFLVNDVPVIGMTLLRDTLDNFWFTLLHEVAHIVLHYRTGLASGFFDDFQSPDIDELEAEANEFASNMLIPEEVWRRSPARIAKAAAPLESLASRLQIHPAIVFGRVRMERQNYAIFSDKIGRGTVRRQLIPNKERVTR